MTDTSAAPAAESNAEHSAPGGAAHASGLRPKFGKVRRMPCGCASDDTRHISFCDLQWELLNLHKEAVSRSRSNAPSREAVDPLLV